MGFLSQPKMPPAIMPPKDESEYQAQIEADAERQRLLKRRGWRSTILTGPAASDKAGKETLG